MNVLIFGNTADKEIVVQHMKSNACMAFRKIIYSQTDDYDILLQLLGENLYDMAFIMADSAAGMEGVIAVQNISSSTPIVWFSNDKNFVAQSYRLGVDYFAIKPINEKTMNLAIARCQRKGEAVYE